MQLNSCSVCGLQFQQHLTVPFDIPAYQVQTDSIKIFNRRTCKQCCQIVANIHTFVEQNSLRFCNHAFKTHLFDYYFVDHAPTPRKSVQLLYETLSQSFQRRGSLSDSISMQAKRLSMTDRVNSDEPSDEQIHPYISLLVEEMLQKNYLTLAHFPKTLQLLVYLSSTPSSKENKQGQLLVLAEERHEKVKNIVLYLTEKIHLSVAELPYVLFLINFLLCFMNPQKAVSIIIQISNLLLTHPQLLAWKSLIFQNQRATHQTPLSPATIDLRTLLVQVDKLWGKIEAVIDLGRRGQNVLREGLIKISKLQANLQSKEYRKKMAELLKSLLSRKQDLESLEQNHLQVLYLIKIQRNGFSLILKEAIEQQEYNRQEMAKMSHKFKMQKDQFIEKIVKLNNKIQALQQTIKQLQERTKISEFSPKTYQKQQIKLVHEQIIEQIDLKIQSVDIKLNSIVTITDLFNFNEKNYHIKKSEYQPPPKDLTERIILQIQKMEQLIQKNASKVKSIQDQKTRLLGIISRKEQRLLAVILEKDTIIERYEQALWTMQNGLEVTEGPLVNRINYIMHIFGNRRSSYKQQQNVMAVVKEAAVKKVKEKDKDCEIY